MKLPADICRCRDGTCPLRHQCARWTFRNDLGKNTSTVESMQDDDRCHYFLDADEYDEPAKP